ncbi:CAP domain-containing protein [Planomonospora sp. ID82291]|uniref:CAP domain-containing protein n=1 Tax=Planomonospora sp. ID82291 TaxID=2738136 RepID=UPI0018C3D243|nr:CAP domain-containing protein [Planomonospora sp. ID82291]MBG0813615.1 CAP domain-containing protein [Planomonospora sp. ID82291]
MWQSPYPGHTQRAALRRAGLFACLAAVLFLGFLLGRESRHEEAPGHVYLNEAGPAEPSSALTTEPGDSPDERVPLHRVTRPAPAASPSASRQRRPLPRASDGPRNVIDGSTHDDPGYVLRGDGGGDDGGHGVATALSAMEGEVVRLTNIERRRAGCAPLRIDRRLARSARAHSSEMALSDAFSHDSPDGGSPWDRMEAAGYRDGGAENIGRGYASAQEAVRGWMANPGHRRNILNCALAATGVGVVEGPGGPWWTQDFGYS